jgi:hypothetical protein
MRSEIEERMREGSVIFTLEFYIDNCPIPSKFEPWPRK